MLNKLVEDVQGQREGGLSGMSGNRDTLGRTTKAHAPRSAVSVSELLQKESHVVPFCSKVGSRWWRLSELSAGVQVLLLAHIVCRLSLCSGTMAQLLDLPSEIIAKIFAQLDVKFILRSRQVRTCIISGQLHPLTNFQVCKFFDDIVTNNPVFQYKVQLALCGMEDSVDCALSTVDRLARLNDYKRDWDGFGWSSILDIPRRIGEPGQWELLGGVFGRATKAGAISMTQIPSRVLGIPPKSWVVDELPFTINDYTFDPSQNLLVIIESQEKYSSLSFLTSISHIDLSSFQTPCKVHIRTMDPGTPHPAASEPAYLLHTLERADTPSFPIISISGDFVGVIFRAGLGFGESELLIWNWKTGVREYV